MGGASYRTLWVTGLAALGMLWLRPAWTAPACEPRAGKAVSVQGEVEIRRAAQPHWTPLRLHEHLCAGDSVRLGSHSRAAVLLANRTLLRLDEATTITFSRVAPKAPSWLDLIKGAVHFISRTPRELQIKTPFVNAAIEGTEFVLRVEPKRTAIWVFEGRVAFGNAAGALGLASGEAAVAEAGKPPQPQLVVRPRDAVQWALYYPPLLIDYRIASTPGPARKAMRGALEHYRRDELSAAFALLDAVPASQRSADYHTLRAGLLLTVGRVEAARSDIAKALGLDPNNSTAYALSSVIAVVQNDRDKALALAQQAERLDPRSPMAHIALSYAYQARFDIQRALEETKQATQLAPTDPLAWARRSDLELSLGHLDQSLSAAHKAIALDPDLARTQIVLGFAHLTQIQTGEAKAAFEKAITMDPAAPLARLGLGLTLIRQGHLNDGTREIEIATILDPDYALIRSYLGKAYFAQRRETLAASEFATAKELDPHDPTPYLYDAILKQSTNRPLQALQNLQRSIELNDNRAVYRSRLLLDGDQAMRGASLARIYDDLGFEQLAVVEASKSLDLKPGNHSAHRFLSDSYAGLPRHEIARVSELLQAQLLQPINVNPVQPRLALADLNIASGLTPAASSFNDFTPLFERNRVALNTSGALGNNDTWGEEVVLSGLYNRFSFSLGQFQSDTDGFRDNNDIKNDQYNVFAQWAATPGLNIQFELGRRDTNQGDLQLRFDSDAFTQDSRDLDQDAARLGVRYSPTPGSDILVSTIYTDRKERQNFVIPEEVIDLGGFVIALPADTLHDRLKDKGQQTEAQYLLDLHRFNLVVGSGYYDIDVDERLTSAAQTFDPTSRSFERKQKNLYVYANIDLPRNLIATVGASYVDYKEDRFKVDRVNPKLGLRWDLTDHLQARFSYIKNIKRALVADRTIEPTQVQGFNQFFDDINGTKSTLYGTALDLRLTNSLYGGVQFYRRDLDTPFFSGAREPDFSEDQDERFYGVYLYWALAPNWSANTELGYDKFKRDDSGIPFDDRPKRLKTLRVPVTLRYFSANGFFASGGGSYLYQDVEKGPGFGDGSERTFVVNTEVGYRLPHRRGILSLSALNLFDKDFRYQDDNFRTSETRVSRFVPNRTILARITLNF
jgi:tetratricopeptide (TPR) repeat protein